MKSANEVAPVAFGMKPPLLSMKSVCDLTTLSRTAINKARNAGRFPQAVLLDGNRLAFVTDEVLTWVAERIEHGRLRQ